MSTLESLAKTWTVPLMVVVLLLYIPDLLPKQGECQKEITILNLKGQLIQTYKANSTSIAPTGSAGLTFVEAGTGKTTTLHQVSYSITPCRK